MVPKKLSFEKEKPEIQRGDRQKAGNNKQLPLFNSSTWRMRE